MNKAGIRECLQYCKAMSLLSVFVISRPLVLQNMIKFSFVGTGRGNNTHAYTHSVGESHHVFLNLHTLRFYCLPDNYEIIGKFTLLYSHIICSVTFEKFVRIGSCIYDKCEKRIERISMGRALMVPMHIGLTSPLCPLSRPKS
jgi:hypothetical protein